MKKINIMYRIFIAHRILDGKYELKLLTHFLTNQVFAVKKK